MCATFVTKQANGAVQFIRKKRSVLDFIGGYTFRFEQVCLKFLQIWLQIKLEKINSSVHAYVMGSKYGCTL